MGPLRAGHLLRPPGPRAADGDAQAAVSLGRGLDGGLDLILLAHVARGEPRAELLGDRQAAIGVDVGDRDLGARARPAPARWPRPAPTRRRPPGRRCPRSAWPRSYGAGGRGRGVLRESAKSPSGSSEHVAQRQARGGQVAGQPLGRELRADLRAQLLARGELDVQPQGAHAHAHPPAGAQAHLDPLALAVEEGDVLEGADVEVRIELAVDHAQQVAVELRRHARAVVVGGLEHRGVLDEVGAQQEPVVTGAQQPRDRDAAAGGASRAGSCRRCRRGRRRRAGRPRARGRGPDGARSRRRSRARPGRGAPRRAPPPSAGSAPRSRRAGRSAAGCPRRPSRAAAGASSRPCRSPARRARRRPCGPRRPRRAPRGSPAPRAWGSTPAARRSGRRARRRGCRRSAWAAAP